MSIYTFSHIIWDWNGTLLDDAYFSYSVFRDLLLARNLPDCSFEDFQNIYGHPVIDMYSRAGFDFAKESFADISLEWHDKYCEGLNDLSLHSDAVGTLNQFKTCDIGQSILSALPHHILMHTLALRGLSDYFEEIKGLDNLLAQSKIENGRILLRTINIEPSKVILIGDSSHDVETAEELGINCYLVSRGLEAKERLLTHGHPVFDDFSALLAHLEDQP